MNNDEPPGFSEPLSPEGEAILAAYDAFYESLTLVPRALTPVERETVWAILLAAAREVHGFIHMPAPSPPE